MTTIREFYSGMPLLLKNGESLTFQQILLKDNEWWDECHDFIQWIFPTKTISQYCPNAPILTPEDAKWLKDNHTLTMDIAFQRFFSFLMSQKMKFFNHNHLRITRAIECITLVHGKDFPLRSFFDFCILFLPFESGTDLTRSENIPGFDHKTFKYWRNALDATFE